MPRIAPLLLLLAACASTPDPGGGSESPSFDGWRYPKTWNFHVVDPKQRSLGSIMLRLTDDYVGNESCADNYWKRAVVLDDRLSIDLGYEKRPAYQVRGPWLTLDLTAGDCNVSHNLIGEISDKRASGYFTQSHPLGGQNIGSFTGSPVIEQTAPNER